MLTLALKFTLSLCTCPMARIGTYLSNFLKSQASKAECQRNLSPVTLTMVTRHSPKWACFHICTVGPQRIFHYGGWHEKSFWGVHFDVRFGVARNHHAVGCGSNSSTSTTTPSPQSQQSGNVFVTGEDAASALGCRFQRHHQLHHPEWTRAIPRRWFPLPTTVDFARLLGLRSPLAFALSPLTLTDSATFVLANPVFLMWT